MNYGKQLKTMMSCRTDNTAMVGVALIGGLAVGAALALLFAPKKGSELREGIVENGRQLSGTLSELMDAIKMKFGADTAENEPEQAIQQVNHNSAPIKRPKSDIAELIHEANKEGNSPEQNS